MSLLQAPNQPRDRWSSGAAEETHRQGQPLMAWRTRATNISFLHTSRLTDGTTGTPRKTGLTVCRNQMLLHGLFRYQIPAPLGMFPPLLRCSRGLVAVFAQIEELGPIQKISGFGNVELFADVEVQADEIRRALRGLSRVAERGCVRCAIDTFTVVHAGCQADCICRPEPVIDVLSV